MPDSPLRTPVRIGDNNSLRNVFDDDGADFEYAYDELPNRSNSNSSRDSSDDEEIFREMDGCCTATKQSCSRFADFQERWLGPLSPERAPMAWMILNAFALSWSLSLGVYLLLLFFWHGDEVAASKATTTHYLLWSLLTTLVWVFEISLRAAFPAVDTVLVVNPAIPPPPPTTTTTTTTTPLRSHSRDEPEVSPPFRRTWTGGEDSVVTLETITHKRSKKHLTVIGTEFVLAIFFGVETVMDCWNHWQQRHGGGGQHQQQQEQQAAMNGADDDEYEYIYDDYYQYEEDPEYDYYSMLQQQSDIWISVLAYAYMTYETYHAYYRSTVTKRNLQRSMSSATLRHHQQQQQFQFPQQHQMEQQQIQRLQQQHLQQQQWRRQQHQMEQKQIQRLQQQHLQHYQRPPLQQQQEQQTQRQQQSPPSPLSVRGTSLSSISTVQMANTKRTTPLIEGVVSSAVVGHAASQQQQQPMGREGKPPLPPAMGPGGVFAANTVGPTTTAGDQALQQAPQQQQQQQQQQQHPHYPPHQAAGTTTERAPPTDAAAVAAAATISASSSTLPPALDPSDSDCYTETAEGCCGGSADEVLV